MIDIAHHLCTQIVLFLFYCQNFWQNFKNKDGHLPHSNQQIQALQATRFHTRSIRIRTLTFALISSVQYARATRVIYITKPLKVVYWNILCGRGPSDMRCIYWHHNPPVSWWRHEMKAYYALLALCEGNPQVTSGFPSRASDTELWCFLWCEPEQTVEQTVEILVIWDAMALIVTPL